MKKLIKFKNLLLTLSLAFAGLFAALSISINNSLNKNNNMEQVIADNGQQQYLYCRIKDDVTYSGDIERFCACFYNGSTELTNNQWPGNAYPGNKLKIVRRGGYIYGRALVPTGVTATHVIFNNGDGYNSFAPWQRTARKQFSNHSFDTYVLDTAGGVGNISGYWTKQLFIDMNDSVWAKDYDATYSNVKAHLWRRVGSTDTSVTTWPGNAVTFVDDFLQDETRKGYGFIEIPKDGDRELMNVIPTHIIFNVWGGETNQNKTSDLEIPYTENCCFKMDSNTGDVVRTGSWVSPWQNGNKGVIFVDVSSCIWKTSWSLSDDELRIYYFDDTSEKGTAWPGSTMSKITINGKEYFKSTIPSGAKYCIVNAWSGNNVRDTTGDLIISGSSCLLNINSTFDNDEHHQRGEWLQINDFVSFTDSPSSTTARIFVNNTGLSCSGQWATSNYWFGVRVFGGASQYASDGSTPVTATMYECYSSWFDGQCGGGLADRYYTCADIPFDGDSYQFVLINKTSNQADYYSIPYTFDSSMFTYIHYLRGQSNNCCYVTKDVLGDANNGDMVGQNFLTYLLKAYDTCSNANENGCGQITNLINHFILNNSTQEASSALYHTMETRPVDHPDHPSGGYEKPLSYIVSAMQIGGVSKNASGIGSFKTIFNVDDTNSFNTIIIIVASSISLLSITALSVLVIKKRKSKEQ